MKIKDLFKAAEEKYQCNIDKYYKTIEIKFDYFTILIEETEQSDFYVKIKRGSFCVAGVYSLITMNKMFNRNVNKILDFIIYKTIEQYYAEKCKKLLEKGE